MAVGPMGLPSQLWGCPAEQTYCHRAACHGFSSLCSPPYAIIQPASQGRMSKEYSRPFNMVRKLYSWLPPSCPLDSLAITNAASCTPTPVAEGIPKSSSSCPSALDNLLVYFCHQAKSLQTCPCCILLTLYLFSTPPRAAHMAISACSFRSSSSSSSSCAATGVLPLTVPYRQHVQASCRPRGETYYLEGRRGLVGSDPIPAPFQS